MELEAAVGILALIIAAGSLLFAVFPGNRKRRLKVAGLSFAVFVAAIAMSPAPEVAAERKAAAAAQKSADHATEQQVRAAEYMETLAASIPIVESFSAKDFTKDAKTVLAGVIALNSFAATYEQGAMLPLSAEGHKLRQKLKTATKRKQAESLPILRDAYGPAMRAALWEVDGKATTFGNRFKTVEFINAAFAANRNIKSMHEDMRPTLMLLRFTRAQYKWLDADVEYQYYSLTPPADDELIKWGEDGRFTRLD